MAVLPRPIRPMLATLRRSLPADQDRYGWEFKWDVVRAIAYVSGGEVRLVSRNDKDMAASYPELAVLAGRVGAPVILDGEIVALRAGRPDFGAPQSRMHVRRQPSPRARTRCSGFPRVWLLCWWLGGPSPDGCQSTQAPRWGQRAAPAALQRGDKRR